MMTTTWGAVPVLDRLLAEASRSSVRGGDRSAFPIAADVRERSDDYAFQLDVPGVKVEDLLAWVPESSAKDD